MVYSRRIGFQAVILCGPGTSLHPFTSAVDLPKALLQIANKPMLHYPLEWCEKGCFDSILILTLAEHLAVIKSYVRSHELSVPIRIEAPSSLDDNLGTADVLRLAYQHGLIMSDFVVLPCDLVTDLDPRKVTKMWMIDQGGFDGDMGRRGRTNPNAREDCGGRRGGFGVWYETDNVEGAIKGQEIDFLAVAPKVSTMAGNLLSEASGSLNTLLFNLPAQVVKTDSPHSKLMLRHSLLRKHPNFRLHSTLRDSGIYFFPFWVLKFIDKNKNINSIREDLLPWWSKCCWQNKRLAEKLGLIDILAGSEGMVTDSQYDIGAMSTTRQRAVGRSTVECSYKEAPDYATKILEMEKVKKPATAVPMGVPALKSDTPSAIIPPTEVKIPSITAYLPSTPTAFIRRVDTIHLYLSISLYLASSSVVSSQRIHASASIDPTAYVSRGDCLIASKVSIAEKAVVKRCVLGHGVSIGKGARLLGCVLMDGASVAEGANLEGCVLGRHAVVGVETKLKDCQVAEGFFVQEEIEVKNECFVAFSGERGGYDATRLWSDGVHDARESTADTDDLEKHYPVDMKKRTAIDLNGQKMHDNIKRAENSDSDEEDNEGFTDSIESKLEMINSLLKKDEEFFSAALSANEQEMKHRNGNKHAIPTSKSSLVAVSAEIEIADQIPGTSVGMVRRWFSKLWVWAVPITGFGIWHTIVKCGERIGFW